MKRSLVTGDKTPEFSLIGSDGMIHTLVDFKGYKGVCFCFFSLGCEMSKKTFPVLKKLKELYSKKSIAFVGVCGKEQMSSFSETLAKFKDLDLGFDILLDATNDLHNRFGVQTTPHAYIFNQGKHLIYSGRILKNTSDAMGEQNANYIALALDQLVGGLPIETPVTDVIGTTINLLTTV